MNSAYLSFTSKHPNLYLENLIEDSYGLTIVKKYNSYGGSHILVSLLNIEYIKNNVSLKFYKKIVEFTSSIFRKAGISITEYISKFDNDITLFNMEQEIKAKLDMYEHINGVSIKVEMKKALGCLTGFCKVNFDIGEE